MVKKRICPVCYGNMILLRDLWNFRIYWQCVLCGSTFEELEE